MKWSKSLATNGLPQSIAVSLLIVTWLSRQAFAQPEVIVEPAFPSLTFQRPVDLQNAGDGSDRLFVVEQPGRVLVFRNDSAVESTRTFLDIRDRVNDSGNEEGLLGLAFHPRFSDNGQFFVSYTATGNRCSESGMDRCSKVSRFNISETDSNLADVDSESFIIEIGQPFSNHNGGQIRFGPDSLLYIALGDGGSGGDPFGNGQNGASLLGSILRIDVDNPQHGKAYGIPPDNPFVNTPFRDEIFAYGLRNPWRFSFDAETGSLWAADVGQSSFEEIDIVTRGGNYGWNIMEGESCYSPPSGCSQAGLELPVWAYDRSSGRSVTGGFVYRGSDIEELFGTYVYGDFVSGRLWGLSPTGDGVYTNQLLQDTGLSISSFGVDEAGELYLCTFTGAIFSMRSASSSASDVEHPGGRPEIEYVYPNPITSQGAITFTLVSPGFATLEIFDMLGHRVTILVNRYLGSGRHVQTISGSDLAPGAYISRLVTDRGIATRKIVVL